MSFRILNRQDFFWEIYQKCLFYLLHFGLIFMMQTLSNKDPKYYKRQKAWKYSFPLHLDIFWPSGQKESNTISVFNITLVIRHKILMFEAPMAHTKIMSNKKHTHWLSLKVIVLDNLWYLCTRSARCDIKDLFSCIHSQFTLYVLRALSFTPVFLSFMGLHSKYLLFCGK